MNKVWDKVANIATWIFYGGMVLIFLGVFLFAIGTLIAGVWIYLWSVNKFAFSLYVLFLISGVIAGINWLIENLK